MKKQILMLALILSAMFTDAQTPALFNPNTNHYVTFDSICNMTSRFRNQMAGKDTITSYMVGITTIDSMRVQSDVKGLKIYNGIKADGTRTLIIFAIDSYGKVINGVSAEKVICCPMGCWPCPKLPKLD